MQRWMQKFRTDPVTISDGARSGRPWVHNQTNIDKVRAVLQADKRTSVKEVARSTGLSIGTTHWIIRQDLQRKKHPAKWIPHLLTQQQKDNRVRQSRRALAVLRRRQNPVEHIIAEDESWFWVWDPDCKRNTCQWLEAGEDRPQKVRQEHSTLKMMLVMCFDREGVVHKEWVLRGFMRGPCNLQIGVP